MFSFLGYAFWSYSLFMRLLNRTFTKEWTKVASVSSTVVLLDAISQIWKLKLGILACTLAYSRPKISTNRPNRFWRTQTRLNSAEGLCLFNFLWVLAGQPVTLKHIANQQAIGQKWTYRPRSVLLFFKDKAMCHPWRWLCSITQVCTMCLYVCREQAGLPQTKDQWRVLGDSYSSHLSTFSIH